MKAEQLIALGFKDTSSPEDMILNDYTYQNAELQINVYGNNIVDIHIDGNWVNVPNCKTITDIKHLIRLFLCK